MKNSHLFTSVLILVGVALTCFCFPVQCQESATKETVMKSAPSQGQLTVEQIVEQSNRVAYYQGKDGRARVQMKITDSQGRIREREFVILRWDQPALDGSDSDEHCGNQKFYVYFRRPADVNKMAFLVWKYVDKDDDRWLYMPALDLVKRIASADKRTSFVGSDFYYEDVSGRNINDDVHELVETTDTYYVLKNTPKSPGSVEFAHYKMWVHKETFMTIKVEYFNVAQEKYREYQALKVDNIQGRNTVTRASMKDLRTGSETTVEYNDVTYDVGVPEDIFSERYLRAAPDKYLR